MIVDAIGSTGGTEDECDSHDDSTMQLNRLILRQVAELYKPTAKENDKEENDEEDTSRSTARRLLRRGQMETCNVKKDRISLQSIGKAIGDPVSLGYQKATLMVIGNISAGKSTFINWFAQEAVQKTGMAIETSGFTFVTSGRCVTELGGESTLALRPHLQDLVDRYPGFLPNLSLKTCPARNGHLKLLDLVDTPGLADGELQYPFDVERIIVEMANHVDLFLVFFDPIGQALGRRVLSVVEQLTDICPDKIRFCLTKVDQIRSEEERIKVMCQTTQSLTAKIKSRHGFDLIPIYIPGAADGTYFMKTDGLHDTGIVNRLRDLVDDIYKSTELRVQDALNGLQQDISRLSMKTEATLDTYQELLKVVDAYEASHWKRLVMRYMLILFLCLVTLVHWRSFSFGLEFSSHKFILNFPQLPKDFRGLEFLDELGSYVNRDMFVPLYAFGIVLLFLTIQFRRKPRVTPKDKQRYAEFTDYNKFLRKARHEWRNLNNMYLNHAIADASDSVMKVNNSK